AVQRSGTLEPLPAVVPVDGEGDAGRVAPGRHRVGDRDARAGPDRGHPLVRPLGGALLAGAVGDGDVDRAVLVARDLRSAFGVQVTVDVTVELVDVPGVPGARRVAVHLEQGTGGSRRGGPAAPGRGARRGGEGGRG